MSISKKRIILCVALSLILNSGKSPVKADVADFETSEYNAMSDEKADFPKYSPLDIIKAAEAYNAGYTGKGVTVAIYDTPVNTSHPEFSNKTDTRILSSLPNLYNPIGKILAEPDTESYWENLYHGTFCASIIAANKDNTGMHGVAYDSNIYSLFADSQYTFKILLPDDTWNGIVSNNNIKIISNSWGSSLELPELKHNFLKNYVTKEYTQITNAAQNDKLLVFASGNSGYPNPCLENLIWVYNNYNTKNYILSVGSLSPVAYRQDDKILTQKDDYYLSPISDYSNLALGMEENTVYAAGELTYSSYANYLAIDKSDNKQHFYITDSGTSFAAPTVSGVAALVQQAFPYLKANQIADTILSTANKNIIFSDENYHVTYNERLRTVELYCFNQNKLSLDEIKKLPFYKAYDLKKFTLYVHYNVDKESVIGQGVVDAGKAVKGLAALNARRLTSSDRNSDFTINGEKCDQALYTVDTADYNSEWSNDISEIKAGLISEDSTEKDLRNRYNSYVNYDVDIYDLDTNTIVTAKPGETTYKEDRQNFTDPITEAYNQKAISDNLIGLHVGLMKKGNGILTLSGNNTYQGSTIAAGGVLEINGSVAGDVWSVENGTIAGCGTINGNLYNNASLQPGSLEFADKANENTDKTNSSVRTSSAAVSGNTLTITGDLSSTGAINFIANGDTCSKLVVDGTADIDTSKINISNMVLNTRYDLIEAAILNAQSSSQILSGMLSLNYTADSNSLAGSIDVTNNTTSALNENQTTAMNALSNLYSANLSDSNKSARIINVLNTDAQYVGDLLTALSNKDSIMSAGAIQHSHAINDAISSHIKSDDFNESLWFKFSRNRSKFDNGFSKVTGNSFTLGYDWKTSDNWKLGFFINHDTSDYKSDFARNSIDDDRYGIYGSFTNNRNSAYIYVNRGHQKNDMNRRSAFYNINSNHGSNITEAGAEFKHNISRNGAKWQFSPYINTQISRYSQSAYSETGDDVFAQNVGSFHNTYCAAEAGIELCRKTTKNSTFSASVGYKRILSGDEPEFNYSFAGDPANNYTAKADFDKNLFTASLNSQQKQKAGWYISEELTYESGSHDHDTVFSLQFNKTW